MSRPHREQLFIADNVNLVRARAGASIAVLLLARCTVVDMYGPNPHLVMGARNAPEQASKYPDLYDAYEYLRKPPSAEKDTP